MLLPVHKMFISCTCTFLILVGTTYGGDGQNTFALPDLQGRVPVGQGAGPGLSNYVIGQNAGTEYTSVTVNQMPGHTHTCTPSGADGCVTGSTGSSVPVPILQPYIAMTYVIAIQGIFPPRSRRARNLRADGYGTNNHTRSGDVFTTQSTQPYLGEIMMVSFNFAPKGWALCAGQLLSIQQNAALFSLLGTQYGGNGQTNFALPDLRGRSIVGVGQGLGLSSYNIGQLGGSETVTLLATSLPAHDHLI